MSQSRAQCNDSLLIGEGPQGPHVTTPFLEEREGPFLGQPLAMSKDDFHV